MTGLARARPTAAASPRDSADQGIDGRGQYLPMTADQIPAIHAVEQTIYSHPWTPTNFRDALQAGNAGWIYRGADSSLQAYGLIMMALDEAHLLNLSVALPYQRRGLGWSMLAWCARQAREFGALTLLLEVRPSNDVALRLYERYGFQIIGHRKGYYPAFNGREDAIVMRTTL